MTENSTRENLGEEKTQQEILPMNPGSSSTDQEQQITIRSRSVSLNRINPEKADSPEKTRIKTKGNSKRKRDTPSPKDSVKDKRRIFEDKLANKYKAQRNAKECMRNRIKKDKPKKEAPEEEESIAQLLREIRGDIKDMKTDLKDTQKDVQNMNAKIDVIEKNQKDHEIKTATELNEIRNEMHTKNIVMQETITSNILQQLKPQIDDNQKLQETITTNILKSIQPKVSEETTSLKENDVKRIIEEVNSTKPRDKDERSTISAEDVKQIVEEVISKKDKSDEAD